MGVPRWTDSEVYDLDVLLPPRKHREPQTYCPHGRSVLLDCAACPDPYTVAENPWLLFGLLLLVVVATVSVAWLIGPGL